MHTKDVAGSVTVRMARRRVARLAVAALVAALLTPLTLLAAPTGAAAVTPGSEIAVYRWWHPGDRDWVGIPAGGAQPSDAQLIASGYTRTAAPQFYAPLDGAAADGMVQVNRWWNAADRDWVDIAEGSLPDASLTAYGYTSRTLQYWLFTSAAAGRVAVNRWWSAADRDWITLAQGEIPDASLLGWGYTGKTLLGYAQAEETVPTAHLALAKEVAAYDGDPVAADAWTLAAAGPTPLSGAGGVERTEVGVGTYTLSETGTSPGYTNGTTWACVDAVTSPVTVANGTVTLEAGDDVACTITNTLFPPALVPGEAAPSAVQRYWNPGLGDWLGVAGHGSQPSEAELTGDGYSLTAAPQFWVPMIGTEGLVAVYRWWHPGDRDWVDITVGSLPDATLTGAGYTDRTFQYFLHAGPADGRVAVNRWWNAADRDWMTLREGEIPDSSLLSWGYSSKTLLGYAVAEEGVGGYFELGTPQQAVVPMSMAAGELPQALSVLDVNPSRDPAVNKGFRYLGYVGHTACGGVYLARANSLDADPWIQDRTAPAFDGVAPCGWPSAVVLPDGRVALVTEGVRGETITARVSTDGLDGTAFGPATVLVSEPGAVNGGARLFLDPGTGRWHLYWAREKDGLSEIRVRSADTFAGLVGTGPADIGTRVAASPEALGAPSVVSVGGTYYLTVQTREAGVVRTRALISTSPGGPFHEVPANPLYGEGTGCVAQHVFGNTLHSWTCTQGTPGDDSSWTLDHVAANLLGGTVPGEDAVDCEAAQCIALTFDDAATTYFGSILDALEGADARGTFFLYGSTLGAKFQVVQRMVSLGSEAGVHAWTQTDLTVLGAAAVTTSVGDTVDLVQSVTGERPTLVRPPFGLRNATVDSVAEDLGLAVVLWNQDPADPLYADPAALQAAVVDGASRNAIVVLRGDLSATPKALPGIVSDLEAAGYTLVTVSQLLGEAVPGQVYPTGP